MSFPRYPAYKESGVEWLGTVPEHWAVKPVKCLVSCNDEVLPENTAPDMEIRYIEISDVGEIEGIRNIQNLVFKDAPSRARRKVREGDIIVSTVRTYLKAIAQIKQEQTDAIASTGFAVLRPKAGVSSSFLAHLTRCPYFLETIVAYSVGVSYPAINASDILDIRLPLPSLPEQRAIAAFLDAETARIDALVAKQEALIATLQEKRRALISHAVTRGLDPAAPMKDSGVPWLGEVPAHWEVIQFRRIIESMCDGPFGSDMKSSHYVDEGVRLIRLQNIGNGIFDDEDKSYISEEHFAALPGHDARPGDLLVAGLGDLNHPVGRACLLPECVPVAMVKADCFRLRLDERKLLHSYAALFLSSEPVRVNVALQMRGATRDRINLTGVSQLLILTPPTSEQVRILAQLDHETTQIDTLIAKAQSFINVLREHRIALIAAAVTGQIDVRGWAGPQ